MTEIWIVLLSVVVFVYDFVYFTCITDVLAFIIFPINCLSAVQVLHIALKQAAGGMIYGQN